MLVRITLLASAVMFGALGLVLVARPQLLQDWVSMGLQDPVARTEVRAFYGGLELGMAAFLLWAWRDPARWRVACAALAFTLLCTAAGRVVGFLADHSLGAKTLSFLAIEVGLGVMAAVGAWRGPYDATA